MEKALNLKWLEGDDGTLWQFCMTEYKGRELRLSILVDQIKHDAYPVFIEMLCKDEGVLLPLQMAVFYDCWDAIKYCENLTEEELDTWIEDGGLMYSKVLDWLEQFQK